MTDAEIYDRTTQTVCEAMHREFGTLASMATGKAAAFIDMKFAEYLRIRRRRPWCRVPWQSGRRPSQQPKRERLWFSPLCLDPHKARRGRLFADSMYEREKQPDAAEPQGDDA